MIILSLGPRQPLRVVTLCRELPVLVLLRALDMNGQHVQFEVCPLGHVDAHLVADGRVVTDVSVSVLQFIDLVVFVDLLQPFLLLLALAVMVFGHLFVSRLAGSNSQSGLIDASLLISKINLLPPINAFYKNYQKIH